MVTLPMELALEIRRELEVARDDAEATGWWVRAEAYQSRIDALSSWIESAQQRKTSWSQQLAEVFTTLPPVRQTPENL